MILEPGDAVFHPRFGHGVVQCIERARDPGFDLDRHRIAFADGVDRDIIGSDHLCSPEDAARLFPAFGPDDVVYHDKFGYGKVVATRACLDVDAEREHEIDFDRGVGRRVIVELPGLLRSAHDAVEQRRRNLAPPPLNPAAHAGVAERREAFANRHGVPAHVRAMQPTARFDLYRQWLYTHVAYRADAFYTGLDPADSPAVWRFIERRYLDRYALLLRVCSVPACDGLWPIDYPAGHIHTDRLVEFGEYGVPSCLEDALYRWSCEKENAGFGYAHDGWVRPDFEAIDADGLALAKQVKRYVGERVYVEYRPWREIVLCNGAPREAAVPQAVARHAGAMSGFD